MRLPGGRAAAASAGRRRVPMGRTRSLCFTPPNYSRLPTVDFRQGGGISSDWARAAMFKTAVIALAVYAALLSAAVAETACTKHTLSAMCRASAAAPVTSENSKVADVLCCCQTYTGGECCTRVARCGGKPPGCFCATPSVPGAQQQLSSLARGP